MLVASILKIHSEYPSDGLILYQPDSIPDWIWRVSVSVEFVFCTDAVRTFT